MWARGRFRAGTLGRGPRDLSASPHGGDKSFCPSGSPSFHPLIVREFPRGTGKEQPVADPTLASRWVSHPGLSRALLPAPRVSQCYRTKGNVVPILVTSERNLSWKKDYVSTLQNIMLLAVFQISYYFIYMCKVRILSFDMRQIPGDHKGKKKFPNHQKSVKEVEKKIIYLKK